MCSTLRACGSAALDASLPELLLVLVGLVIVATVVGALVFFIIVKWLK